MLLILLSIKNVQFLIKKLYIIIFQNQKVMVEIILKLRRKENFFL